MRARNYIYILGMVCASAGIQAGKAEPSYADVAVVINTNSSCSTQIGEYFKSRHGIPSVNIIYVSTSTTEEIDSVTFNALRAQIESHLVANNLLPSINYIVTTKGVPLKVNRGNTFSPSSPSSSVESELALLLGPYASSIGQAGRFYSPYYAKDEGFSRSKFGFFLVTRLDGYTTQEVLDLIDRGGPNTPVARTARYVFDQDPTWNATAAYLNTNMATAQTALAAKGLTTELNSDSIYLTSRSTVLGYVSWGSNDRHADQFSVHAIPNNSWSPGALAETYVSTSGRSFDTPPSYGQSLVADLVAEGVSGAKGYVYEPYTSSMADVSVLFGRYTSGANLAESYYMASRYLSWMDVVIGDPKTTIVAQEIPLPVQLSTFSGFADEFSGHVTLSWTTLSEVNNYGFFVERAFDGSSDFQEVPGSFVQGHGTTLVPQSYRWIDSSVSSGTYLYRLRQMDLTGTVKFSEPQLVRVARVTSVATTETGQAFRLNQNYPNPFNPTTEISFTLVSASEVKLAIYDLVGREVSVLLREYLGAGLHRVAFSGTGLASGTYICRLTAGQLTDSRRMMLVK